MRGHDARREWISEWFLEFSVLWAVFPLLDQIVGGQPFDVRVLVWSFTFALPSFVVGLYLHRVGGSG